MSLNELEVTPIVTIVDSMMGTQKKLIRFETKHPELQKYEKDHLFAYMKLGGDIKPLEDEIDILREIQTRVDESRYKDSDAFKIALVSKTIQKGPIQLYVKEEGKIKTGFLTPFVETPVGMKPIKPSMPRTASIEAMNQYMIDAFRKLKDDDKRDRTIRGLRVLRDLQMNIHDMQFLIDTDGTIVLIDPQELKTGKSPYTKSINRMIRRLKKEMECMNQNESYFEIWSSICRNEKLPLSEKYLMQIVGPSFIRDCKNGTCSGGFTRLSIMDENNAFETYRELKYRETKGKDVAYKVKMTADRIRKDAEEVIKNVTPDNDDEEMGVCCDALPDV